MKKRALAMLLALVMAVGMLPTSAWATSYESEGEFKWNVSTDAVEKNILPKAEKLTTGYWSYANICWSKDIKVSELELNIYDSKGKLYDRDHAEDIEGNCYFSWLEFETIGRYYYYWKVTYEDGTEQTLKKTNITITKGEHIVNGVIWSDRCYDYCDSNNDDVISYYYSNKKGVVDFAIGCDVENDIPYSYKSSNAKFKVKKEPQDSGAEVIIPKNYVGATTITITIPETDNFKKCVMKYYICVHPKRATIKKAMSPKKGQLKVTWGKVASCDGYYVCYAVKGSSKWKKIVTDTKSTSAVIKGLKSNKKYKVYVAAYKKYGKIRYWSSSKTKSIKVK